MKVCIVGAGPGAESALTLAARERIKAAGLVVTTRRLTEQLGSLNANTVCREVGQLAAFIKEQAGKTGEVCVLASGDVGFFSVASQLKRELDSCEVECLPGLSSLQYLAAKAGFSYEDVKVASVHGRTGCIIPLVAYNRKTFFLTGGRVKAHDVIAQLLAAGLNDVTVTVGENLSAATERVVSGRAGELLGLVFDDLAAMFVQNDNFARHYQQIRDKDMIRGNTPMTKEAVRTLSVAALDIKPADRVADIGAGTGSVAVAMARAAYEGSVLAIERSPEAVELIKRNREKFGAYNVIVRQATAPAGLAGELFDKAFVGGSAGNMEEIVSTLVRENGCTKIVVNAITLETLQEAQAAFKKEEMAVEISCINSAHAEHVGSYHMMKADNPVYIIAGEKA